MSLTVNNYGRQYESYRREQRLERWCGKCGRAETFDNELTYDFVIDGYVCYPCQSLEGSSGGFQCPDTGLDILWEVDDDGMLTFEYNDYLLNEHTGLLTSEERTQVIEDTQRWIRKAYNQMPGRFVDDWRHLWEIGKRIGVDRGDW